MVRRLVAEHHHELDIQWREMDRSGRRWLRQDLPGGGQAVKAEVDGYYNAIRPQAGNETWLLQATLTFVFPD